MKVQEYDQIISQEKYRRFLDPIRKHGNVCNRSVRGRNSQLGRCLGQEEGDDIYQFEEKQSQPVWAISPGHCFLIAVYYIEMEKGGGISP